MQQPPGGYGDPSRSPNAGAKPKSGMPVWVIVLIVAFGGLVFLGIVFIFLAAAGFSRYMAASKTAEAKATVGSISRAAVAAYERESSAAELLGEPEGGGGSPHKFCDSAVPVPASLADVRGKKYAPSPASGADFDTGTATAGWKCLRFSMSTPMFYRYGYAHGSGYLVPSTAPGPDGFEASAQGDLDGDGTPSTFARTGKAGPGGTVILDTAIYIDNETE